MRDHLPQGEMLRGQCLERVVRVKKDASHPGLYGGYTDLGEVVPMKISDTGIDNRLNGDHTIRLFTVETVDGRQSFCPDVKYTPLPTEAQRRCPSGVASCPYFDELKGRAMLIPGYWKDNAWHSSKDEYTVACISGVVAKCVKWGYKPGALLGGDPQKPLEETFQACIRAARADYLGDGRSFTCSNTKIDMYDRWGLQKKEVDGYTFESLWDKDGLVCLKRPRYPGCPGLTTAPDCDDPVPGTGGSWSGVRGLIAVSSSGTDTLGGRCPTARDACASVESGSR
ncbi:hypothetical protein D7V93_08425 [Corallococcus llansteffanensis]|uniref:ADYC domain-containing protein n=2 Tax=Corallococcus llansteffanensis TaxID=2316731 RepID=A0A3A8QFR6_9BACT|nr:hypothetical protein D7V93_08425 [Corallococcus llansteffanensis]